MSRSLLLSNERLGLTLSTAGGSILAFRQKVPQGAFNLMRPYYGDAKRIDIPKCSCFPLAPFGVA